MVVSLDYNNDDVMEILNNPNYSDVEKKELFEKYKSDLKENRRKEIIDRLNGYAKNNPIITQEEYISMLKKYNNDDLSKPFEIIEKELNNFNREMQAKYDNYLKEQELARIEKEREVKVEEPAPVPEPIPEPVVEPEVEPNVEIDDTNPNLNFDIDIDDIKPDVTPFSSTNSKLEPTVFETNAVKEVNSTEIPESNENKGSASAIIISIIAIIVGMVIMYSIIRLK